MFVHTTTTTINCIDRCQYNPSNMKDFNDQHIDDSSSLLKNLVHYNLILMKPRVLHYFMQQQQRRQSKPTIRLRQQRRLPLFVAFFLTLLLHLSTFIVVNSQDLSLSTTTTTTEPYHATANLGENVILRCVFDFPEGYRVPYVIQWEKKNVKIPIYIWYDGYHPHIGEGYENRVSLSGRASLNLTNVRDTDQGWYECKIFFLNRPPEPIKNGTWVHLDVLAPPQFRIKPPDVIYVKIGESITLPCETYGTPTPQIIWYKDNKPLKSNSNIHIYNHELQIDNIQLNDIGEYRCTSHNPEGSINAITKIIIAGPAVITIPPPQNTTKLQGDRVELICEARALPSNVTYRWFHDGQEIGHLPWQESRFIVKPGMLIINPSVAEDSGHYTCEVSNGIGSPDTASAYLNIEFPARVYYSPTIQYLPFGLSGIVRCFIQASPPFQFVTWTKDHRPFDPNSAPDVTTINNGSLLFTKVSLEHQGIYRCTPYNVHGTAESSQPMEILVRDPPVFTRKPKAEYVRAVNDEISIQCDGNGQPKPNIYWRKADGTKLSQQRERTTIYSGNITIKLLKKEDHGRYECVLENEIAAITADTLLIINNTTPHTPTNISVNTSYFAATIRWQPSYNGGYEQTFHLSYRISDQGDTEWKTIRVPPPETTNTFTLYNLQSDNEYQFQVYATNRLGSGQPSTIISASTKPWSFGEKIYPTDASGATYIPTVQKPSGPKPDAPRNLTFQRMAQGWVLSWHPPSNITTVAVAYYRVEYRRNDDQWLYTDPIPYDTAYLFEKLESNSHYIFRVWAYSILGVGEVSHMIEINIDDYYNNNNNNNNNNNHNEQYFNAIIASIIGGFIFFSMSIVLILCLVKVCNRKKRRKIEKSYVMVTCPVVNGNVCFNETNSMPSKQQFEMFDSNHSQATSDFMINHSMPNGSIDMSRVATASLDNSTTTTNTTGTTGSDQPLIQQHQQQLSVNNNSNELVYAPAMPSLPTMMAENHQQMPTWPNVLIQQNNRFPTTTTMIRSPYNHHYHHIHNHQLIQYPMEQQPPTAARSITPTPSPTFTSHTTTTTESSNTTAAAMMMMTLPTVNCNNNNNNNKPICLSPRTITTTTTTTMTTQQQTITTNNNPTIHYVNQQQQQNFNHDHHYRHQDNEIL